MATPFKKVQSPAVALYTGLSAAGTQMIVTPFPKDLDGNKLTMAALGTNPQVTVDPKISSYEEIIGFTGITDNGDGTATLTGLSRDMASSNLATPGTGKQHGSGAVVIFSWNPQDVLRLGVLENDQTWAGINTFSIAPIFSAGFVNTARVQSVSNAATITPASATNDMVDITAIAQAFTIANPTGSPTNFQRLIIRILDNGVARGITFGNQYRALGVALPIVTIASKYMILGLLWNSTDSKWDLVSINNQA